MDSRLTKLQFSVPVIFWQNFINAPYSFMSIMEDFIKQQGLDSIFNRRLPKFTMSTKFWYIYILFWPYTVNNLEGKKCTYLPWRRASLSQLSNSRAHGAMAEEFPLRLRVLRLCVALPDPIIRTPSSLRGANALPKL